jgi:ABC transporter with metal-binding/Fe-S-binding domain ATP-binding protein
MRACLFSGGKDSTLAIHRMHDVGKDVELLITFVPDNAYSYMFHKADIEFTALQARALGIKQLMYKTKGEKEKELEDIERALRENRVTELVTGAVASTYQKERVERLCRKLSITHFGPLWGMDPEEELTEISRDFKAIITQVSADGFDSSYLGATIDGAMIEKLKRLKDRYEINMSFEGGEAESFVLDAPLFRKRVEVAKAHVEWSGSTGRYIIDEAVLKDKA